ncbi:MAG TPA: sugar phosphate isomerase/epimerase family protein [Verrucomicrobiae bacterium]|jgi:sugar phosphate isomerase/epimerase
MRFAICNEIFQGWTIEATLEYCAKLGYGGLEIAPFTLAKTVGEISPAQRRHLRQAAERAGVALCGLHWLLAKTEGLYLNHTDPAIRERTAQYLCDLVECCADLGGKILVLGSPQQRNVLPGVSREQAWDLAAQTLAGAVRRAEAHGVAICFEPLSPAETNFINTAAEAIRFAGQFNSAAMKIILDVKAMCSEPEPIPQIIRQSWPHFAHFHANDKNLKGPGFGEVDFAPISAALEEAGYDGWVSVEVFKFEEGPEAIARGSLECLRRNFRSPLQQRLQS